MRDKGDHKEPGVFFEINPFTTEAFIPLLLKCSNFVSWIHLATVILDKTKQMQFLRVAREFFSNLWKLQVIGSCTDNI